MELKPCETLTNEEIREFENVIRKVETRTGKHFQIQVEQAFSTTKHTINKFENRRFRVTIHPNASTMTTYTMRNGLKLPHGSNRGKIENDYFAELAGEYQNHKAFQDKVNSLEKFSKIGTDIGYDDMSVYYVTPLFSTMDECQVVGRIVFLDTLPTPPSFSSRLFFPFCFH